MGAQQPTEARRTLMATLFDGRKRSRLVVFGVKPRRANRCHDSEKLLECHMDIEKTALAKYPPIVIENFVGDHQREERLCGNRWESTRLFDLRQLDHERGANFLLACLIFPERNHFTSGA